MKENIGTQALRNGFSPKIINDALPSFLATVGLISLFKQFIPFGWIVESIFGLFYFVVFTEIYLVSEDERRVPNATTLLRKVFKIFMVNWCVNFFVLLGLILIVPGIVFMKRFIYAGIVSIAEGGDTSWAINRSKELSLMNGYSVLSWYLLFAISAQVGLICSRNLMTLYSQSSIVLFLSCAAFDMILTWLYYTVGFCLILEGYKNAIKIQFESAAR